MNLAILLYHGLYREETEIAGKPAGEYVSVSDFSRQLSWLSEKGYELLSLRRCRTAFERGDLPEKAICLTFDDGKQSDLQLAAPILKSAGAEATFFVVPGWLGSRNIMVASDVRELESLGMEIGSHSWDHPFLSELGSTDLARQVNESKKYLEDLLGRSVESFSYPYGDLNRLVRAEVERAGYAAACSSRRGANAGRFDWLALRRWTVPGRKGLEVLQRIVSRRSLSARESAAELLKRGIGMRRYVGWKERWLRKTGD